RFRRLLLGAGVVVLCPREDSLLYQLLRPTEIDASQIALSLGGRQLSPLLPGVKLDKYVSGVNRLAGLKGDPDHGAREVRAHGHALYGRRRADYVQGRRPRFTLGDSRRDSFRRRLEIRVLCARGLNLPELHKSEARQE